jgi:cobalamin synthase
VGCWTIAFGYLSKKLLGGGLTGDCYGAINETSEVIGMITLLILFNTNGLLG